MCLSVLRGKRENVCVCINVYVCVSLSVLRDEREWVCEYVNVSVCVCV